VGEGEHGNFWLDSERIELAWGHGQSGIIATGVFDGANPNMVEALLDDGWGAGSLSLVSPLPGN
jgi:hypothetical protein